jgi:hypothetical protein
MLFPRFGSNLASFSISPCGLTNSRLQAGCPPPASWRSTPVDLVQKTKLGTSPPSPISPPLFFARVPRVSLGGGRRLHHGQLRAAGLRDHRQKPDREKRERNKQNHLQRPPPHKTQPLFHPPQATPTASPTDVASCMRRREAACPLHKTNKSSPVPGSGAEADSRRHSHAFHGKPALGPVAAGKREHCRPGQ